jgi:hypothetical protein
MSVTGIVLEGEPASPAGVRTESPAEPPERLPVGAEVESPLPAEPDEEIRAALAALRKYPELDQRKVRYHLQQSRAMAVQGYYRAAIDEARAFLVAIATGIGQVAQRSKLHADGKVEHGLAGLKVARRYLLATRMLNERDSDLLTQVLGMVSAPGPQDCVPDAGWCDVTSGLICTMARHLLRRYESWKFRPRSPRK